MSNDLKPCPFCGAEPKRTVKHQVLSVECPNCVSVGFHNHARLGCLADSQWNTRNDWLENDFIDVVQQFVDSPTSKAARQAVINALEYYRHEEEKK